MNAFELFLSGLIFLVLVATVEPMARHGGSDFYSLSLRFVMSQMAFVLAGALVGWAVIDTRQAHRVCPFVAAGVLTLVAAMPMPFITWVVPFMWHIDMGEGEIMTAMAATATICMITACVTCSLVGRSAPPARKENANRD